MCIVEHHSASLMFGVLSLILLHAHNPSSLHRFRRTNAVVVIPRVTALSKTKFGESHEHTTSIWRTLLSASRQQLPHITILGPKYHSQFILTLGKRCGSYLVCIVINGGRSNQQPFLSMETKQRAVLKAAANELLPFGYLLSTR